MRNRLGLACRFGFLALALGHWGHSQDFSKVDSNSYAKGAVREQTAEETLVPLSASDSGYRITCQALNGPAFGVAKLLVEGIPADDVQWGMDQVVQVNSDTCRVWFPARVVADGMPPGGQHSEEIYFIFHAGFPKTVDLSLNGRLVREDISVAPGLGGIHFKTAVASWWNLFCAQTYELAPEGLAATNRDLLESLGQLLRLEPAHRLTSKDKAGSQLEKEFERTLGMLLGFESVRLAMMTDESKAQFDHTPAQLPLPASLRVAALQLPASSFANTTTPVIASLVPQDCYLVRCQSLENYLWLRGLLVDWGGSINELVSSGVVESDVRGRLERQLAVSAETLSAAGVDSLLEDMAVIGSDVLFEQGAGVGVLFQTRPGLEQKLEEIIQTERAGSGIRPQSVRIGGINASLVATPDHQVRSYYVRTGNFLLLTNSSHIANSVVQTRTSGLSLANLTEFKYALANNRKSADSKILFYLSDPFFRRLTSAPFRIELGRRRAAENDCRRIEMAEMIARATGHAVSDKGSLVNVSVLPAGFGSRSDGSSVEIRNGSSYDTLRGKPGTFLPVVDVKVTHCNESERAAYHDFTERYRQEWRVMDPVLAGLDAFPLEAGHERLNLSVHITPYARQEYQFLSQFLGSTTQRYLSAGPNELMGVSASLQQRGTAYSAHLGLLDSDLDFVIDRGRVVVDGKPSDNIFVNDRSFAAVTPSDTQGLLTLNGLMKSLQQRKPIPVQVPPTASAFPSVSDYKQSAPSSPFSMFRSVFEPQELLLRASITAIEGAFRASALADISQDDRWAMYAADPGLHEKVRENLIFREASQPAEIHAVVNEVKGSAIEPYLNAFKFSEARRESAKAAAWLNQWTNGLKTNPNRFLQAVEQGVSGQIVCPLGGRWELQPKDSIHSPDWTSSTWLSSQWQKSSLVSVNCVPEDYRFPFLDWFGALELDFSLNSTSLKSDILVKYQPSADRNRHRLRIESEQSEEAAVAAEDRLETLPLSSTQSLGREHVDEPEKAAAGERVPGSVVHAPVQTRMIERPVEIGIRINPSTMIVSVIKAETPASRSMLQIGDRIVAVNGTVIGTMDGLRNAIVAAQSTGIVSLSVDRRGRRIEIEIKLDSPGDVDL